MKKLFTSCLALFAANHMALAGNYSYKLDNNDIKEIVFANGKSAYIEKSKSGGSWLELSGHGPTDANNDFAQIVFSAPSKDNAEVAIITTNCSGIICNWYEIYVAYIHEEKIFVHKAGNTDQGSSDFKIDIITNAPGIKIKAFNLTAGTNSYGDTVKTTRTLAPGIGFISNKFLPKYLQFPTQHPDKFLSDEKLREPLAKAMGLTNFRELRAFMSGPGLTTLEDGKWLEMRACMAHACDERQAAIIVNAENGNTWAVWVDQKDRSIKTATTAKWDDPIGRSLSRLMGDRISYKSGYFRIRQK